MGLTRQRQGRHSEVDVSRAARQHFPGWDVVAGRLSEELVDSVPANECHMTLIGEQIKTVLKAAGQSGQGRALMLTVLSAAAIMTGSGLAF